MADIAHIGLSMMECPAGRAGMISVGRDVLRDSQRADRVLSWDAAVDLFPWPPATGFVTIKLPGGMFEDGTMEILNWTNNVSMQELKSPRWPG